MNGKLKTMKINLKQNSSKGDFKPITTNRYGFVIEKAEVNNDDKEGREKINLTLSILGEGEFRNRKVWQSFWLTPTAIVYLATFIENLDKGSNLLAREDEVESQEICDTIVEAKFSAYLEAKRNPKDESKTIYRLSKFKPYSESTDQSGDDPFNIF